MIICLDVVDWDLREKLIELIEEEYDAAIMKILFESDDEIPILEEWYTNVYKKDKLLILITSDYTDKLQKRTHTMWSTDAIFVSHQEAWPLSADYITFLLFKFRTTTMTNAKLNQYRRWVTPAQKSSCAIFFAAIVPITITWILSFYYNVL